jgi:chemotaxis methyl-accepting protein methylase
MTLCPSTRKDCRRCPRQEAANLWTPCTGKSAILVYKVSGIYKAEDKLYLLADGCGRRMKQLERADPARLLGSSHAQPNRDGELRQLLNEITIGETCLFRSQPQLDALRKVILPEIVEEKPSRSPSGCASGARAARPAKSPTPWP